MKSVALTKSLFQKLESAIQLFQK